MSIIGGRVWADPLALVVNIVGSALNAATWGPYTGWDGTGTQPVLDVPVGDKRPNPAPPSGRFVRVLDVTGSNAVQGGFVETHLLELEAYAPSPRAARALLLEARAAVLDALGQSHPTEVGPRVLRAARDNSKPAPLPTGRDGEERYRMALEIDLSTRG